MATISRLKSTEISNGNVINADDLDAEFDQLVSESNSKETRLTNLESNTMTIAGVKTFSSTPKMNAIAESTSSIGVTVDGLLIKDNALPNHMRRRLEGEPPMYNDAASIILPAGLGALDSAGYSMMRIATNQTVSLASSGANGLDTGSEASDTWYYVYLIASSTDSVTYPTKGLFSVTNEAASGSVTLPTGYDLKRQLPLAVRNDGSSNIIPFYIGEWSYRATVFYQTGATYFDGTTISASTTTNVLTAGTATSYTNVSLTSYVPPISEEAYLNVINSSNGLFNIRTDGETHEGIQTGGGASIAPTRDWLRTASQVIEYRRYSGSSGTNIDVLGYRVTEI